MALHCLALLSSDMKPNEYGQSLASPKRRSKTCHKIWNLLHTAAYLTKKLLCGSAIFPFVTTSTGSCAEQGVWKRLGSPRVMGHDVRLRQMTPVQSEARGRVQSGTKHNLKKLKRMLEALRQAQVAAKLEPDSSRQGGGWFKSQHDYGLSYVTVVAKNEICCVNHVNSSNPHCYPP